MNEKRHLVLGIQTALTRTEIAVMDLDNGAVIGKSWEAQRDEIKNLNPGLEELIKSIGGEAKNVGLIVVVNGPGPYSAVRIGVTVANVFAMAVGAKMIGMKTQEYENLGGNSIEEKLKNFLSKLEDLESRKVEMIVPFYLSEAKITESKKKKFV